jgi:chromosome segregation ATPase
MIEATMYFVLGLLVAALLALMIMPAVWRRAVRLTRRQIEGSIPLTLSEIQADKDQLRAEFAMTTRRLEMNIDELQEKANKQLIEISNKQETMRMLALEQDDKEDVISVMEQREADLREKLRSQETALSDINRQAQEAQRQLAEKSHALERVEKDATDAKQLADSRQIELLTSATQIGTLSGELAQLKSGKSDNPAEIENLQSALKQAEDSWHLALSQNEELQARVDELLSQVKTRDESLDKQGQALTRNRKETATAEKASASLNAEILTLESKAVETSSTMAQMSATLEKVVTPTMKNGEADQQKIKQLESERKSLMAEVEEIRAATVDHWQTEKMDAAILRERLNDIAAKVALLTAEIDGPKSSVRRMIDEISRDASKNTHIASEDSKPGSSGLAQRILALQNQAD